MRLLPLPRRHRILWLIAAVLAVFAWGYWLAATGRTPDYGDGNWGLGAPQLSSSRAPVAEPPMTAFAVGGDSRSSAGPSISPDALGPAVSSPAALAGMTDPVAFTRSIAQLLLEYGQDTDFDTLSDAVMAVAALPPLGSPSELTSDLAALTPAPAAAPAGRTVTFAPDTAAPSRSPLTRSNRHRGRRPNSSVSGCRKACSRSTSLVPR